MKFILALLIAAAGIVSSQAQNKTFRLIDAEQGDPVPFASVLIGAGKGTISNAEGFFSIDPESLGDAPVKISCMGYRTKHIAPDAIGLLPEVLELEPAVINLNEVRVGGGTPTVDAIMAGVRRQLATNYDTIPTRAFTLFFRQSEYLQFEDLELELEKATHLNREKLRAADSRLRSLGEDIVRSNPKKYLDFKGIWKPDAAGGASIAIQRVTELVDHNKDYSPENIQNRAQAIIAEHLDSTRTYKVKSGIFKIEDEMSPNEEFDSSDEKQDSLEASDLNSRASELTKLSSWQEGTMLREFLDPDLYKYEFLEATYFDGYYVYAIGFKPDRRKAKYSGTLYVESTSYGILKADYSYASGRRGSKVNLKLILGIKYVENLSRGTAIFRFDDRNKLIPYFSEKESGSYIYLHRNLKFIENSPGGKKLRFDFLLEGAVKDRKSMLLRPASDTEVATMENPKKIKLIHLDQYEPGIWQDSEIIEPLEDMKAFRVRTP